MDGRRAMTYRRGLDPVTHTLVGAVTAQGFFKRKVGPEAVPVLCWASNLPDIDALVMLSRDPAAVTMRRTFGHSVFLYPLLAAALAYLFKRIYPKQKYLTLLGLCLLGTSLHVFFDLVNSFGVVALWPFSLYRPELAIVFIIDLLLTGMLAAPLLLAKPPRLPHWCRVAAAAVCGYVLFCAASRMHAELLLSRQAAGVTPELSYVFPEPLGPHRWRGVLRMGDEYRIYLINAITGRVDLRAIARTDANRPAAVRVREVSPRWKRLEPFFKAPVWKVTRDAQGYDEARVHDLRFTTLVLKRRGEPFAYRFRVLPGGLVEEL